MYENDVKEKINYINRKINKLNIDVIDIIGIYNYLIYSKTLFKTNSLVVEFIINVFNIDIPVYITKSRTLLAAKISRTLYQYDEKEIETIKTNTLNKFNAVIKDNSDNAILNKSKKKNENNNLKKWLDKL